MDNGRYYQNILSSSTYKDARKHIRAVTSFFPTWELNHTIKGTANFFFKLLFSFLIKCNRDRKNKSIFIVKVTLLKDLAQWQTKGENGREWGKRSVMEKLENKNMIVSNPHATSKTKRNKARIRYTIFYLDT